MNKSTSKILFLTVAATLIIIYLCSPIIQINSLNDIYSINAIRITTLGEADSTSLILNKEIATPIYLWPLIIMGTFISFLAILTIFIYNKRRFLRIMSVINIVFIIAFAASVLSLGYVFEKPLSDSYLVVQPGNFMAFCSVAIYALTFWEAGRIKNVSKKMPA